MKPRHPIDCIGDLLTLAVLIGLACMAAMAFGQIPTATYATLPYEAAQ